MATLTQDSLIQKLFSNRHSQKGSLGRGGFSQKYFVLAIKKYSLLWQLTQDVYGTFPKI